MSRFLANRLSALGAVVIALFVLVALFGPWLIASDPLAQDLSANYQPASWAHPLGTDHLGRDNLSRMIYGARVSLTISVTSVGIGLVVGAGLGLMAAFKGGSLDALAMRLVDMLLAFPDILLAIAMVAILGKGMRNTIMAVAIFSVPTFARIARAAAQAVVARDYVQACRAQGASDLRILLAHVLPNCLSPILVQTTIMLGTAILISSGLSFLGLGVQPPDPEWGAMLSKGRELVRSTPIAAIAPGVAITLVVLAFSVIGDGIRDAMGSS
jgi:peptide/nickel transport system permease protein